MPKFLSRFSIYFVWLWQICMMVSCTNKPSPGVVIPKDSVVPKDISIRGVFSDQQVLHTDSLRISQWMKEFPQLAGYLPDIQQFYAYRNYSYAWYDRQGLIEQASHLYSQLDNLSLEGIQIPVP